MPKHLSEAERTIRDAQAAALRRLLRDLGLPASALARSAGLREVRLHRVLRGEGTPLTAKELSALEHATQGKIEAPSTPAPREAEPPLPDSAPRGEDQAHERRPASAELIARIAANARRDIAAALGVPSSHVQITVSL